MTLVDVPVLVTGADGFIGSHLVERLVDEGARVRAFCQYNSRGSLGWLDTVPPATRDALDVRLGDIRDARVRLGGRRRDRGALPSRRTHSDPVLLRRRRVVRPDERPRHAQRARGRPPNRRAALRAHLHQRGLRHARDAAHHGGAPAQRPIALRRHQGRGRPAGDRLPALVRRPGGRAAALQHVRAAPVAASGPADDDPPDARRAAGDPAGTAGPAARPDLRGRHRRRVRTRGSH